MDIADFFVVFFYLKVGYVSVGNDLDDGYLHRGKTKQPRKEARSP